MLNMFRGGRASLVVGVVVWFTTPALAEGLLKFRDSQFEPIKWSELAGWTADDHLAAYTAYQTSCQALLKSRRSDGGEGLPRALSNVCRKAAGIPPQDTYTARAFFEQNFQPLRIGRLGEAQGLLTGYFEPIVAGSRFPSPEFHVPLYRRPRDLEAAGYKVGSAAFPNKGVRIGRRNENNELVPYHDRAAIEAGALDGQKLEICWLRSSLDLLTIQIEGSGRVILEDGTPLRVSFDSHNGYAFSSVERVLIDRHIIARKDISTQAVRDWMAANPDEAAKVRAANRSYVFFRITDLTNEGEPLGAQGVPLTPGRSIAVDRAHQYGTPFFIEAQLPIEGRKPASPFRRLMIAQDTDPPSLDRRVLICIGARARRPAASPVASAIPAVLSCCSRARSTLPPSAVRRRCLCRDRRSLGPRSRKKTVKPGQDLTAPLRSRLAARCHRQRFGRRTTRVAVEGLARFAFIGDRHNAARMHMIAA